MRTSFFPGCRHDCWDGATSLPIPPLPRTGRGVGGEGPPTRVTAAFQSRSEIVISQCRSSLRACSPSTIGPQDPARQPLTVPYFPGE